MKGKKVVKNKKIKSLSKFIIMNSWIEFSVWRPSPPTARFNSDHVSPLTLCAMCSMCKTKSTIMTKTMTMIRWKPITVLRASLPLGEFLLTPHSSILPLAISCKCEGGESTNHIIIIIITDNFKYDDK